MTTKVRHFKCNDEQFLNGLAIKLVRGDNAAATPAFRDYTHWFIESPSFSVKVVVEDVRRVYHHLPPYKEVRGVSPCFYNLYQDTFIMITVSLIRKWFRHTVEWGKGAAELNTGEYWEPVDTTPIPYKVHKGDEPVLPRRTRDLSPAQGPANSKDRLRRQLQG